VSKGRHRVSQAIKEEKENEKEEQGCKKRTVMMEGKEDN
jgi:hypothetical protein